MKLLLLNYEFPPLGGGAGNATYYLLKEFAKRKDLSIDLVTSSVGQDKEKQLSANIKIYYLDIGKKGNIHYQTNKDLLWYSLKSFFLARKLIKADEYRMVHAFFGIPCGLVAMLLDLPFIVSLRGSDVPFYNPRYRLLDAIFFQHLSKLVWRKARAVVANSEELKDLALQTSPNQKIIVIYNGVDTKEFYPGAEEEKDHFVVLSTSRLIERKGVEYLIRGFAQFDKQTNSRGKLVLAGSGNQERYLRGLTGELGINSQVEFRGPVNHDQMADLYRQADVFVLPSQSEGMSNSLLEAMATGLPVVTTATGGTKELVSEDNGVIVTKGSNEEISQALERMFEDKKQRLQMGRSSRQKAEALSWQAAAREYESLYENQPR